MAGFISHGPDGISLEFGMYGYDTENQTKLDELSYLIFLIARCCLLHIYTPNVAPGACGITANACCANAVLSAAGEGCDQKLFFGAACSVPGKATASAHECELEHIKPAPRTLSILTSIAPINGPATS